MGFYLLRSPVVTVIGKAFYEIDHSGKNPRRNRRNYDSSLAIREIHTTNVNRRCDNVDIRLMKPRGE
jgi:hypothetical protein